MEKMITVSRAGALISETVQPLTPVMTALNEADGLVLAENIFAPQSIPAYPQSSMDGFAFAFKAGLTAYHIKGEMAAGSNREFILEPGTAVRIFTGAAVPSGSDTVLVQEKASLTGDVLQVLDPNLSKGNNVRPIGSEIMEGSLALEAGHQLHAGSIGFIAGMGVPAVSVFPKPQVSVIVTGNELQEPGAALGYGQVYESNSLALGACLSRFGITQYKVSRCVDDPTLLASVLGNALDQADLVLMTGGVSVGDYDFTLQAFRAVGVIPVFHKIKQKPGKPILFGMKGSKPVFGLPGNPASVLTCFYEYVLPAIGMMMRRSASLQQTRMPIAQDYRKPAGLTHFLKARTNGEQVWLQTGQESYKLSSFATANCLVVLPEDMDFVSQGQEVEVHLFP
jgi:molybdopterin molybdotransferase